VNHSQIVSFIWGVADLIRDTFKRGKYQDVILPLTVRDAQDGEVGIVGYEINFNRYFYEYRPPRPLEEIEADIQTVEKEIVAMLREVAG
jgi:type I restriction-modification system DNA methylase subunit